MTSTLPPTIAQRVAGASQCHTPRGGRATASGALFCAATLVLLSGCASNSVTTLLKASNQTDAILPSASVVQNQLKARAFEVGTVGFDLRTAGDRQGPDIPDSAYLELLHAQLNKGFASAELGKGAMPAYRVNVAIERLQLKPARFPIPEASVLRVRMEIAPPDAEIVMRGQFQSFFSSPTVMVIVPGFVAPIGLPSKGWEYVALAKMFPAVAVVITTTTQGLQQGKTLEEIKVYPQDIEAGTMISPDLFLKNNPFGITQMNYKEIDRAIRTAQACERR
jgi:hypothetical protein